MDDELQSALGSALESALEKAGDAVTLAPVSTANAHIFGLIAALGVVMALVYLPLRLFLTLTTRSRRLRLLQRIRRLREELGQSVAAPD